MKEIHIKVTTAGGKVIDSKSQAHNAKVQKSFEELVESIPNMNYLTLVTDTDKAYIYEETLANSVIELVIFDPEEDRC